MIKWNLFQRFKDGSLYADQLIASNTKIIILSMGAEKYFDKIQH